MLRSTCELQCRRSSRSPTMLSILLVMVHSPIQYGLQYSATRQFFSTTVLHLFCRGFCTFVRFIGRAGASPPSRTAAIIFLYINLYIYIRVGRRALNLLRASFSPIFQYFSAVNDTRVSFSPIFQYFLTCMPCMAPTTNTSGIIFLYIYIYIFIYLNLLRASFL